MRETGSPAAGAAFKGKADRRPVLELTLGAMSTSWLPVLGCQSSAKA